MSLYADYIKERGVKGIVEIPEGFATYAISGEECYVEDVYVAPEHRKKGTCFNLADQIANLAKAKGCKYMTSTVVPSARGSTESVKVILAYGFKLAKAEHNAIWFYKEI